MATVVTKVRWGSFETSQNDVYVTGSNHEEDLSFWPVEQSQCRRICSQRANTQTDGQTWRLMYIDSWFILLSKVCISKFLGAFSYAM